eukprot:1986467-Rhodomonas_salina.1
MHCRSEEALTTCNVACDSKGSEQDGKDSEGTEGGVGGGGGQAEGEEPSTGGFIRSCRAAVSVLWSSCSA